MFCVRSRKKTRIWFWEKAKTVSSLSVCRLREKGPNKVANERQRKSGLKWPYSFVTWNVKSVWGKAVSDMPVSFVSLSFSSYVCTLYCWNLFSSLLAFRFSFFVKVNWKFSSVQLCPKRLWIECNQAHRLKGLEKECWDKGNNKKIFLFFEKLNLVLS